MNLMFVRKIKETADINEVNEMLEDEDWGLIECYQNGGKIFYVLGWSIEKQEREKREQRTGIDR